jgi:hypothetical protein
LPEDQLLDVNVQIFDPGKLPSSKSASRGLSDDIRKAEARYIPVHLRDAIQRTGQWGAVRVVPAEMAGTEVLVFGKILKSDGEVLELQITASDALGKRWFKKTFKGKTTAERYESVATDQTEVFEDVYALIAEALVEYRRKISPERARETRQIAELRFAEEFVPDAFGGYLERSRWSDEVTVERLPAEGDPLMTRVRRIRERDYLLVDTLDSHYEGLSRDMSQVYTDWRRSRFQEIQVIRKIDARKNAQVASGFGLILLGVAAAALGDNSSGLGSAVGGAAAAAGTQLILQSSQISEEAEINKAALEEMGVSFGADARSIVVEVEGQTVELTGSAEEKYARWQEVLMNLHALETDTPDAIVDVQIRVILAEVAVAAPVEDAVADGGVDEAVDDAVEDAAAAAVDVDVDDVAPVEDAVEDDGSGLEIEQ